MRSLSGSPYWLKVSERLSGVLHEISVLIELTLGHLCYRLTDVPPQPNSPPDDVFRVDHPSNEISTREPVLRLDSTLRNK